MSPYGNNPDVAHSSMNTARMPQHTMRTVLLVCLFIASAIVLSFGQIVGSPIVQVSDTWATVSYTAPDASACHNHIYSDVGHTIELPVTNTALFTNADNDLLKYPLLQNGTARQFRFGIIPRWGRTYPGNALDGLNYSLALAWNTTYYYTLCGAGNFSFVTENMPMGRTMPPARPVDKGKYVWPTLDYTNRNKFYIDPSTGSPFNLVNLPTDDQNNLLNKTFSATGGSGIAQWTNPANLLTNTSDATYTGAGGDIVCVSGNITGSGGGKQVYDLFFITTHFTGSSASGQTVQAAISLDGCATAYTPWQNIPLTSSSQTYYYPAGANSHTAPTITPVNTWMPSTNNIQFSQVFNTANFGIMFKTTGSDIHMKNVQVDMYRGYSSQGFAIGNEWNFAPTSVTVQGSVGNGSVAYYLGDDRMNGGEASQGRSEDTLTGTIHNLGKLVAPTTTGVQTNSSNGFMVIDSSHRDHTDPTKMYTLTKLCAVGSESSSCPSGVNGTTILACQGPASGDAYYDTDAAASANYNFSRGCAPIQTLPNNIETLATAFDATFDSTKFTNLGIEWILLCNATCPVGMNGHSIMKIFAKRGSQNSYGWEIIIDLADGSIKAMMPSWIRQTTRWDGIHTPEIPDDNFPCWSAEVYHGLTVSATGQGIYKITVNTALNGTDPAGTATVISVSGDPVTAGPADSPLMHLAVGDIMDSTSGSFEEMQVSVAPTAADGYTSMTVTRGYGVPANTSNHVAAHLSGASFQITDGAAYHCCRAGDARPIYWNWCNDPHGTDISLTNIIPDNSLLGGGHEGEGGLPDGVGTLRVSDNGINGYASLLATAANQPQSVANPGTLLTFPQGTVFAGIPTFNGGADAQKHPTPPHFPALANAAQILAEDLQGYQQEGTGNQKITGITQVASCGAGCPGSLWSFTSTNWHDKYPAHYLACGMYPVLDVSGIGSVIDGTSAHNYEFCKVKVAGECVAGSVVGAEYMNCPFTATPSSAFSGTIPAPWTFINGIEAADWPAEQESMIQWNASVDDPNNTTLRIISSLMTPLLQQSFGVSALPTPDGKWLWGTMFNAECTACEVNVKLPPAWTSDGVARNTWIHNPVAVSGLANATHTIIKFGDDTDLNCTSRGEKCIAASSAFVDATPFYYETSESGSYTGVDCHVACTIDVPQIDGRPVDYQIVYRNGSNTVLQTNAMVELADQTFTPGVASSLSITVPAAAFTGQSFTITVKALGSNGNVDTAYSGTVTITSSDGAASLPAPNTLTNGIGTFTVTLNTGGNKTLTAGDGTLTVTSSNIAVTRISNALGGHMSVSGNVLFQ